MAEVGPMEVGITYNLQPPPELTLEQLEGMRQQWDAMSDGRPRLTLDAMAELLMPLLLERLRETAPAEAKALASAAAEVPGLDALACAALADWLEEKGLPDVGARVRALPLKDGDLLVMRPGGPISREQWVAYGEGAKKVEDRLREAGRNVVVIAVPHEVSIQHLRTGKREGT